MKNQFVKSQSGKRYLRLDGIKEFRVVETHEFPNSHRVIALSGRCSDDWVRLFEGTKEECEGWLENLIGGDK